MLFQLNYKNIIFAVMKKLVIMSLMLLSMILQVKADERPQPGEAMVINKDCYGTVVPETLDKLTEYIGNNNFEMFSTFFKFGYATNLDKDMHVIVVKVQGNKVLVKLDNQMQWWVSADDIVTTKSSKQQ